MAGNVGVIYLSLSKAPPAGQEVAVNFGRKPRGLEYIGMGKSDKGFRLMEGERFVFNADNWNQPAMAVIQLDPKLKTDTAVTFAHQLRQHPRSPGPSPCSSWPRCSWPSVAGTASCCRARPTTAR